MTLPGTDRNYTARSFIALLLGLGACGEVADMPSDGGAGDAAGDEVTLTITLSGDASGTVASPSGLDCGPRCSVRVPVGTTVMLTATPHEHAEVRGWTVEGCSNTCEVTVDRDMTIDVTFELERFSLDATKVGNGTIVSAPTGINCGAVCSQQYPYGTSVTLTATPDAGWTFLRWTGACAEMTECTVSLVDDVDVGAWFAMDNTLVVATQGNGEGAVTSPQGIDCGTDCIETFAPGTTVTLVASSGQNSVFTGWSGACMGLGTCTVAINAATMVTATFSLIKRPLQVAVNGAGAGMVSSAPAGITCGSDCIESFDHGTTVVLTATPEPGSVFIGWDSAGPCAGSGTTCTLAVTEDSWIAYATFQLERHDLTIVPAGNGAGVVSATGINCGVDCKETYDHGTQVTLTATPASSSVFDGWTGGGCSGTGTCTVAMTAARSVTATFTLKKYAVTVTKSGTGTVTSMPSGISCGATCTSQFEFGQVVSLTATPGTGWVFSSWSGACTGTTPTCNLTMTAARSATATFIPRGTLYTIRSNDDMLRRLDPVTLQYTDIGPLGVDFTYGDCAWSTGTNLLYMVPYGAQQLFRVSTTTGAATLVGTHGLAELRALAFHPPSGYLYAIGSAGHLYRINPTNASTTFIGTTGIALDGLSWDSRRSRMIGLQISLTGGTHYVINLTNGVAANLASAGSINNAGLTYDPIIDRHWAVDTSGNLLSYAPGAGMERASHGTGQGQQACITYRP